MDNTITSQRTRRGSQERWSASATTKLYDAEGNLTTDPAVAVKAQVRWRYDAKQRKATFSGPATPSFKHAAWLRSSPPPPSGRVGLPQSYPATPTSLPEPARSQIVTVADLIEWHSAELRSRPSNRTGSDLQGKTLDCYDSDLSFIQAALMYPPGDPRLGLLTDRGVVAGDSLTLDPDLGVGTADLHRMMDLRWSTNTRSQQANERRMQLWAETTRQELGGATGDRREPQHPAAPRLKRETASPETAHACFRTAQRLFRDAASRGVVSHQIWTLTASDRPRLPKRQITTNTWFALEIVETLDLGSEDESYGK